MIKAGFSPNISDEGKDFVATWFPGFPLLSHPAEKKKGAKTFINKYIMQTG